MANDDTFMKVTNKDIYNELKALRLEHQQYASEVTKRLDVTNGKVKLTRWIATTAMLVALAAYGFVQYAKVN